MVVHGACHGAWCWYKVVTLLKSAGHKVSAVDLGASGINPKQLDEIPTFCGYFKPLNDFMAALPPAEKVILVGHSFGGISVSVAMEKFAHNISVAVFVTAFMPTPDFDLLLLHEQVQLYLFSTYNLLYLSIILIIKNICEKGCTWPIGYR